MSRMYGDVPENVKQKSGSVSHALSPRHRPKILRAMKAPYSVKRLTSTLQKPTLAIGCKSECPSLIKTRS